MNRVLILITQMNRGGAETHIMNYFREIRRQFEAGEGPDVTFDFLVNRDEPGLFEPEILQLGGRIFRMGPMYPWTFRSYKRDFTAFLKAHPEYIAIHSHLEERSAFPLEIAADLGIPLRFSHAHNTYPFRNPLDPKWYFRQWFRARLRKDYNTHHGPTQLLTVSDAAARWLYGPSLTDSGEVLTVPNALDISHFLKGESLPPGARPSVALTPPSPRENPKTPDHSLLFVGRLEPQKNPEFPLHALADLPNSRLTFLGTGSLEPNLRQLADKLGIASRVEFLGSVDNPEAYMREADLLLMPSRFEGFGLAALEAQLAGLPVVASPAVSPEVVVSDGVEFVPLEVSSWVTAVQNWRVRSEPVHLDPDKLAKFDIRLAVKDYCNLLNLP